MRQFKMPQMMLVSFTNENVIATSLGCNINYCDGFTCPQCDNHDNCPVQGPCTAFKCNHYLCPEYTLN